MDTEPRTAIGRARFLLHRVAAVVGAR